MICIDMQQITKDLMKVASNGILVGESFSCGYCRKISDEFGSKNVTFSNEETLRVCEECVSKLQEIKGVKIQ